MYSYTLQIRDKNDEKAKCSLEELLHDIRKRSAFFISDSIHEVDDFTSMFTSFEDMNKCFEEIYTRKISLCVPMIIVDRNPHLDKSYIIPDIVYKNDIFSIRDVEMIKEKLIYYLKNNPDSIFNFPGLSKIRDMYADDLNISFNRMIEIIVLAYFNKGSYKKSRDTYFKIRKLERDGF